MAMKTPQRIYRKNYLEKLPEGSKLVGRPTRWGNPYDINEDRTAAEAVKLFRDDLLAGTLRTGKKRQWHITVFDVRRELKGFDLACYCDLDAPCHADVLIEIANS
jgi:hypothetical protein